MTNFRLSRIAIFSRQAFCPEQASARRANRPSDGFRGGLRPPLTAPFRRRPCGPLFSLQAAADSMTAALSAPLGVSGLLLKKRYLLRLWPGHAGWDHQRPGPILYLVVNTRFSGLGGLLPPGDAEHPSVLHKIRPGLVELEWCSATRFLRNSDRIIEKK